MITKWLQAGRGQSGPGYMPTISWGFTGSSKDLLRFAPGRNADSGKGDVIRVTRYRRDPASRAFHSGGPPPSLSRRTPSIGRGHRRTPWMEAGDPTGPPNRTLEPLAAPWGEAGDASTRKQSPAGQPLQPEPDS